MNGVYASNQSRPITTGHAGLPRHSAPARAPSSAESLKRHIGCAHPIFNLLHKMVTFIQKLNEGNHFIGGY